MGTRGFVASTWAWGVKIGATRVDEMYGSAAVHGVVTPRPVRCGGLAKWNPQIQIETARSRTLGRGLRSQRCQRGQEDRWQSTSR